MLQSSNDFLPLFREVEKCQVFLVDASDSVSGAFLS